MVVHAPDHRGRARCLFLEALAVHGKRAQEVRNECRRG